MQLENQCTSLQLSKELKEAGVAQNSLFYWENWPVERDPWQLHYNRSVHIDERVVSAFTCAELGELLPRAVRTEKGTYWLEIKPFEDGHWSIGYFELDNGAIFSLNGMITGKLEVEIRGQMLIYLLKEKLITLTTLNNKVECIRCNDNGCPSCENIKFNIKE